MLSTGSATVGLRQRRTTARPFRETQESGMRRKYPAGLAVLAGFSLLGWHRALVRKRAARNANGRTRRP